MKVIQIVRWKLLFLLVFISVNSISQTYLSQDFTSASGSNPPTGWSVEIDSGLPGFDIWRFNNPNGRTVYTPISGKFAIFDSHFNNTVSGNEKVSLVSPLIDLSGATKVLLDFDHQYFHDNSKIGIDVSEDGGFIWTTIYSDDSVSIGYPSSVASETKIDITSEINFSDSAKIRFRFQGNHSKFWMIDNIRIYDDPGCASPSNLTVDSITFKTSDISWQSNAFGAVWQVEYDTSGFLLGSGNSKLVFSKNTSLSNLNPLTEYEFYVREICAIGDTSDWSSKQPFSTNPYCGGNDSTLNANGCGTTHRIVNVELDSITNNTGSTSCGDNSYSSFFNLETTLVPGKKYTLTVETENATSSKSVWIDFNGDGDYDDLDEQVLTSISNSGKQSSIQFTVPFSQYNGPTGMRVRSSNKASISSTESCSLLTGETEDYIVNIRFAEECKGPNDMQVIASTFNSAFIYIDKSSRGIGWQLQVDTIGFTPGTSSLNNTYFTFPADSIYNLSPYSKFEVYAREVCAIGDTSGWFGPQTIITTPHCRSNLNISNCGTALNTIDSVAVNDSVIARNVGCSENEFPGYSYHDDDAIVVTPGSNLTIKAYVSSTTWGGVWIDFNQNGLFDGFGFNEYSNITSFNNYTATFSVPETLAPGYTIMRVRYGAFYNQNAACTKTGTDAETEDYLIYIDSLDCYAPSNLYVVNVDDSSVTLNWDGGLDSNKVWDIYLESAIDTTLDTLVEKITSSPFTIKGLMPGTSYNAIVRSNCELNSKGVSRWSDIVSFETFCGETYDTLLENFSSYTDFPICWFSVDSSTPPFGENFVGLDQFDFYNGSNSIIWRNSWNTSSTINHIISTPKINNLSAGTHQIRFYSKYTNSTEPIQMVIGGMKNPSKLSSFETFDTVNLTLDYQEYIIDLKQYSGDANYIGFNFILPSVGNFGRVEVNIDSVNYEPRPTCPRISDVQTIVAADTFAVFDWQNNPGASYKISYGIDSLMNHPDSGVIVLVDSANKRLSELTQQTPYGFYVQAICSSTDSSFWNGPYYFKTKCKAIAAGTLVDFSTGIPDCWIKSDTDATFNYKWAITYGETPNFLTGPDKDADGDTSITGKYIYANSTWSTNVNPTKIETTPIDLSSLTYPYLFFDYHAFGFQMGNLIVEISTDYGNNWNELLQEKGQIQTSSSDDWLPYQINLNNYRNQTIIVRFTNENLGFRGNMAIDNFLVDEAPKCVSPNNIKIINDNYFDKALVGWQGFDSTTNNYALKYGATFFNPNLTGTFIDSVEQQQYLIESLTANSLYDVYVRAQCISDTTEWIGPLNWRTECNVQPTPLYENFNATTFIPSCWSSYSSTTEQWLITSFNWQADPYDGNSAFVNDQNPFSEDIALEMPTIDVSSMAYPTLRFMYQNPTAPAPTLEVQYLNGNKFTTIKTLDYLTAGWEEINIDLRNLGDTLKLRFLGQENDNTFNNDIGIDTVSVTDEDPNDLEVTRLISPTLSCNQSSQLLTVEVCNNGVVSQNNVPLTVFIDTTKYTTTFSIDAFKCKQINLGTIVTPPAGFYNIYAYAELSTDTKNENDTLSEQFYFNGKSEIITISDTSCALGDTLHLIARGQDKYKWYNDITKSKIIGTDSVLTIDNFSGTKTYYVDGARSLRSNSEWNPDTNYFNLSNFNTQINFDVNLDNVTLDSVTVLASGLGTVVLNFYDSLNNKLKSVSHFVFPDQDTVIIPINFEFKKGQSYYVNAAGSTVPEMKYQWTFNTGIMQDEKGLVTIAEFSSVYLFNWKMHAASCTADLESATAVLNPINTPNLSGLTTYCSDDTSNALTISSLDFDENLNGDFQWYAQKEKTSLLSISKTYQPDVILGSTKYYFNLEYNGCSSEYDSVDVEILESPQIELSNDTAICYSESITLIADGTKNFIWSNGATSVSQSFTPLSNTEYWVSGDNNNICGTDTSYVEITVNPIPSLSVSNDTSICDNDTILLSANSNAALLWSTNEQTSQITISPVTNKSYSVTAIDTTFCSQTKTIDVTVLGSPTVKITGDSLLCENESTNLIASGASQYFWNTGDSTALISVSPNSTIVYSVIGTNPNLCSSKSTFEVILQNDFSVSAGNDTSIITGNTANLKGIVSGNSSNKSYLWSPDSLVSNTLNLNTSSSILTKSVSFNLEVVDNSSGCSVSDDKQVTVTGGPLTSNPTISGISFCEGKTVNAISNAGGGSGIYTYRWKPGILFSDSLDSSPNFALYDSVEYVLEVNDGINTLLDTLEITIYQPPIGSINADTSICFGDSVSLIANGGSNYLWSTGDTLNSTIASPLSNTTFYVTISNSYGCENILNSIVSIHSLPNISTTSDTSICVNDSIELKVSGASNYLWSTNDSGTSIVVSPFSNSTYTVEGTDVNGCSNVSSIEIEIDSLPAITAGDSAKICGGDSVTLLAQGGITYTWENVISSQVYKVSPATSRYYSVQGTGLNGCYNTDSVYVSVVSFTDFVLGNDTSICAGQNIRLTVDNYVSYLWNTGNTSNSIIETPLITSYYSVQVTDQNNCSGSDSILVVVNDLPNIEISKNDTICELEIGQLNATGGNSYFWNNGLDSASINISPTNSSKYIVYGMDSNGCSSSDSAFVIVNSNPTIITSQDTSICYGDSTEIFALGGINYLWSDGSTSNLLTVSPVNDKNYKVTVTNTDNCSSIDSVNVFLNKATGIFLGNDTSLCTGETILLSVGSSLKNIKWSTGDTTNQISISPISTQTVYVETSDINACASSDTILITIGNNLSFSLSGDTAICQGDTSKLNAISSGFFSWSTGDTTSSISVSPNTTSKYIVTVNNSQGCFAVDSIDVTVYSVSDLQVTNDTSICEGESVVIVAAGFLNYTWNNGSKDSLIVVSPNSKSKYFVTATTGNGCSAIDSVVISIDTIPRIFIGNNDTLCKYDQTILKAVGAVKYSWSNGLDTNQISISIINNTNYIVTGTDDNGCSNTDSIKLFVYPNVIANAGLDQTICSGDSAILSGLGGMFYEWNPGNIGTQNITVFPTDTTFYSLKATDINGCIDLDSVAINVNPSPIADAGNDTSICNLQSAILIASGGSNYQWINGPNTRGYSFKPSKTDTFTVIVSNSFGCTDKDEVIVEVFDLPAISISNDTTICNGDTVFISSNGGNTYLWNNAKKTNKIVESPSSDITYKVTVTSMNGCSSNDSVSVLVNVLPGVSFAPLVPVCEGKSSAIITGGSPLGGIYSGAGVSNGKFDKTIGAGLFKIDYTISDKNGCKNTASQTQQVIASPNVSLLPFNGICKDDGLVTLIGGSPTGGTYLGTYVVNNVFSTTASGLGSFDVSYFVKDANGCADTAQQILSVNDLPTPNLGNDTTICINNPYLLNPGSYVQYNWNTGENTPTIIANQVQQYIVTVTDANGCKNTDEVVITIDVCPFVQSLNGLENKVNIFPNPTNGVLNIDISKVLDLQKISLSSIAGESILEFKNGQPRNPIVFDLSTYPQGIYLLKIETVDDFSIFEIIIK